MDSTLILLDAVAAAMADSDPGSDAKATFELYHDSADEWRWRLRHDNGNVIADSGEGYSSKAKARQGLRSVKRNASAAPVEEVDV